MKFQLIPLAVAAALVLTGCVGSQESTTSDAPDPPAAQATSTASSAPPSADATQSPVATSPSVATPSSDVTQPSSDAPSTTASATAPLTIYYVAMEDAGTSGAEIGCGDSLVATYTADVTFTDQLSVTMANLLANHDQFLGQSGLYNALYMSHLEYTSGSTSGDVVTVKLAGELVLGGTCDAPRAKAQLEQTAMTATGSGTAEIFVNGVPLDQLLSGK